jgi:hypothetical protein
MEKLPQKTSANAEDSDMKKTFGGPAAHKRPTRYK